MGLTDVLSRSPFDKAPPDKQDAEETFVIAGIKTINGSFNCFRNVAPSN